jgi:hypothetical protein
MSSFTRAQVIGSVSSTKWRASRIPNDSGWATASSSAARA